MQSLKGITLNDIYNKLPNELIDDLLNSTIFVVYTGHYYVNYPKSPHDHDLQPLYTGVFSSYDNAKKAYSKIIKKYIFDKRDGEVLYQYRHWKTGFVIITNSQEEIYEFAKQHCRYDHLIVINDYVAMIDENVSFSYKYKL
jgi:hypothetical protein